MITYLCTGDLPISDSLARKILMLADQFTLDGGVLWHFLALNLDMTGENFAIEVVMHPGNLETRHSKILS